MSVFADYKDQVAALKPRLAKKTTKKEVLICDNCIECSNLIRPGKDNKYCKVENGCERVYGEGHPARHLPEDSGTFCPHFIRK